MTTAARDVLINLKYAPDKGNAAVLRKMSQDAMSIQQQIAIAAEQSAVKQAKSVKTVAELTIKSQREIAREVERTSAKAAAAQMKLENAYMRSAQGALQMAKGLATLGLVGEESTEKILRGLLKVQSAYDVAKGVLQLSQGLRAIPALAGSFGGGAEATGGVAAAGGTGIVITISAAAAALAGVAAAAVAVTNAFGARDGLAAKLEKNVAPGTTLGWLIRERNLSPLLGKTSVADEQDEAERQQKKTDRITKARDAQREGLDQINAADAARIAAASGIEDMIAQAAIDQARTRGGEGRRGENFAVATARVQAARARSEFQNISGMREQGLGSFSAAQEAEAKRKYVSALEQVKKAEEERLEVIKQAGKTAQETAKQDLDSRRQALAATQSRANAMRSELQSKEEKFASLDPAKQAQAVAAARKAQQGQALSEADRAILGESGLGEANESVKAGIQGDARKRISAAGADDLFAPVRNRISQLDEAIAAELEDQAERAKALADIQQANKEEANRLQQVVRDSMQQIIDAMVSGVQDLDVRQQLQERMKNASRP